MVAICVWVRCMQSSAIRAHASAPPHVFFVSCFPRRYMPGSIRMPARAPAKRQPKGVMPNIATKALIRILPSGGWLVSYGTDPTRNS